MVPGIKPELGTCKTSTLGARVIAHLIGLLEMIIGTIWTQQNSPYQIKN